ncbi:MAG TPA: APC family permease [Candidatus Dormibacteraeota bacterium]|jgi:amino acid transporter|nr:APC family permease [Candidatus Dormibacteraeota bacterium]
MTAPRTISPPAARSEVAGSPTRGFRRHLGFWPLLGLSVGNIIGSGWLFAAMFGSSIAGPAAVISWLIVTALVLMIGTIYAELSAMHPESGGTVRYSAYSHGLYSAGIISFGAFLALVAGGGSEVTAVLTYLAHFWPMLLDSGTLMLTPFGTGLGIVLLIAFTGVALMGVRYVGRINLPWTALKVAVPLLTLGVFAFAAFHPGNFNAPHLGGFAPYGAAGIFAAIPLSGMMYAFGGFRNALDVGHEGSNPKRDLPLVLFAAIGLTAVIYILLQIVWIGALPGHDLAKGWANAILASPWATLAAGLNLTWMAVVLYADSVVSPAGVSFVGINRSARIIFSMGDRTQFFPTFMSRLSRRGVPWVALWLTTGLSCLSMILLHSWQSMVAVLSVLIGIEYGIGAVAVTVLRGRGVTGRRFRGMAVIAPVAFIIAGLITYWSGWEYTRIGFPAIIVLGTLVYWWSHARSRREAREFLGGVWLIPYLGVMMALSWLGSYGGGIALLHSPWDSIAAAIAALVFYAVGVRAGRWFTSDKSWRETVGSELSGEALGTPEH